MDEGVTHVIIYFQNKCHIACSKKDHDQTYLLLTHKNVHVNSKILEVKNTSSYIVKTCIEKGKKKINNNSCIESPMTYWINDNSWEH